MRPKRKIENTTNKEEFEEFGLFTCIILANTQMELLLQRVGKFVPLFVSLYSES